MKESCENCQYHHLLKHNFKRGKGFEESFCCDVWMHIDHAEDSWIQEVSNQGVCELFTEKEKSH